MGARIIKDNNCSSKYGDGSFGAKIDYEEESMSQQLIHTMPGGHVSDVALLPLLCMSLQETEVSLSLLINA